MTSINDKLHEFVYIQGSHGTQSKRVMLELLFDWARLVLLITSRSYYGTEI